MTGNGQKTLAQTRIGFFLFLPYNKIMAKTDIIEKIKKSGLRGRSGSGFPVGLKWELVKKEKAKRKYIICNASEGEPGTFKDGYILQNYPAEVIRGIKIALKTINNSSACIYLNKNYYRQFKNSLETIIGNEPIVLFEKPGHYIAGEETSLIEALEEKRPEPRLKPPYPTQSGLFGYPTLINNVETFYYVARIAKNKYKNTRFYSISGAVEKKGAYELPENWTIEKILKATNNYPDFRFFVQVGGGACGEILLPKDLKQKAEGTGSIIVFNRSKTSLTSWLQKWAGFLMRGNCDKCVPCREGIFRIKEMAESKKINKQIIRDMAFVLEKTSFCPLGKSAAAALKSFNDKLLR